MIHFTTITTTTTATKKTNNNQSKINHRHHFQSLKVLVYDRFLTNYHVLLNKFYLLWLNHNNKS